MTSNAILKGIKSNFMGMMETVKANPLDVLCEKVTSASNQEDYWIPLVGSGIVEILDTVQLTEIADKNYTIRNKNYSAGIREDRDTIEDSKEYLGASVEMKIRNIANEWNDFSNTLVENLLLNSTNATLGLAFDGTVFFSTSRPNIASALSTDGISNTSTGTGTTLATIEADFASRKTAMLGYKDKNKRPFNRNPEWYVLAPVGLTDTFERLFNADVIDSTGSSKSNIYKNAAKVITLYNTTGNTWYLANAAAPVKPFIIQNRQSPEWYMEDNQKTKYVDYFMKARVGAGYGTPWAICRTVQ